MGRRRRGTLIVLRYLHIYRNRHGTEVYYFRRGRGPKARLRGTLGSPEFLDAYQAALSARPAPVPIGIERNMPDSIARWIALYFESATFAALAPDTRRTRRNLLERFRAKHGEKRAPLLQQQHIERMIGSLSPVVARNFLKALRPWLKWCVRQGLRADNPASGVERPSYKTSGYRTWPDEYVERFRRRHPIGSRARLALELLVNTGAARADVARLGKQHIRAGLMSFRRHKTGVPVEIPVLPELQAILEQYPSENLTFLLTDYGKPFSDAGFGNWFRVRCNEAGIPPGYSAHGIRKYAASGWAERGATAPQLMAWFGWLTMSEAQRYIRDADRRRLAISLGQMANADWLTGRPGEPKTPASH